MSFTIHCTECGRPLATTEEDSEEGSVTCGKCGAEIEYQVRHDIAMIRLKSYATLLFPDEKRRFTINCPECGRRIARSADGTDTTTVCPKCGAVIRHEIKNDTAYIKIEKHSEKHPTASKNN